MLGKLSLVAALCIFTVCNARSTSDLHSHLRRALDSDSAQLCQDKPECQTIPNICTAQDPEIAKLLCPVTCGACICKDNIATGGNCTSLMPAVCQGEFAYSLCAKTCNVCGLPQEDQCYDHTVGITCAELPNPCNDDLGKIACPKFCGFCATAAAATTKPTTQPTTNDPAATTQTPQPTSGSQDPCAKSPCLNGGVCTVSGTSFQCTCPADYSGVICHIASSLTTAAPTTQAPATTEKVTTAAPTAPSGGGSCPDIKTNKRNIGCIPAEIVFMIEYSYYDSTYGIDHEGDFIKELIDEWQVDENHIRIGIVVYHDTVREAVHIDDFKGDKEGLKRRISSITRQLRPSGISDLAKALDFVRENSFKGARPGAERIVVPIVHQMNSPQKERIPAAAQRLKDSCAALFAISIYGSTVDYNLLGQAVTQPKDDYYQAYSSFSELENVAKYNYHANC